MTKGKIRREAPDQETARNKNYFCVHRRIAFFIFYLFSFCISAQSQRPVPYQQVRGTVVDQFLQTPIEGATVTISASGRSVITDVKGNFRFDSVAIGIHQLMISSIAYKQITLDNINLISGKETVLNISMESRISLEDGVVIRTAGKKNKPLNEMSVVSARAFSVEETQKYAAAVNDPSRMAMGFPGVLSSDDGNNNIIIRGNSPTGLLWRMEGVDIPNPNHFSATGSSGGGISILSTQLLSNSDFITGAFASEYGNALSGVFDLKLRRGNNEKQEYTLQAGLLGLNAAAEGPIMPFYSGSYLINYRYSTLSLLNKIGIPLEEAATNFQDLAYNIYLPTKRSGTFTFFGFGGLSSQLSKAVIDSSKWQDKENRYQAKYRSNTAATGITHTYFLRNKTNIRSALAFSFNRIGEDVQYVQDDYQMTDEYRDNYQTRKWTLSSTVNHKYSKRSSLRAGAMVNFIGLNYFKRERENEHQPLEDVINSKNQTQTVQIFTQWQFKPAEKITLNIGLHSLYLNYNQTKAVEPRASVKWQANENNSIAFGFGGHSQIQALGVYFARHINGAGNTEYPNRNLEFTKAQHYVLSYQHAFNKTLSLKTELYYQYLSNVPVGNHDSSTFSILNVEREFVTNPLVNKGKGKNYGVEISIEKYLSNYFYYTISTSVYQSKYKALDGIERDTRFNGNFITNMVAGKEFLSKNKLKTYGINIKTIYAGGLRTTPVDVIRSEQEGKTVFQESEAYTLQNPNYFRTDLRLSIKWNRTKRLTSTLSLDIQNLTNRLNVYGEWYDADKSAIVTEYQNGLIPVLNYKVEF